MGVQLSDSVQSNNGISIVFLLFSEEIMSDGNQSDSGNSGSKHFEIEESEINVLKGRIGDELECEVTIDPNAAWSAKLRIDIYQLDPKGKRIGQATVNIEPVRQHESTFLKLTGSALHPDFFFNPYNIEAWHRYNERDVNQRITTKKTVEVCDPLQEVRVNLW
jgi:hypothetical protein